MGMSTQVILRVISSIPAGKVMSYGQVAKAAGITNGARQVVRALHSQSRSHDLPWWRVIRSDGRIGLPEDAGGAMQRSMLEAEGIEFDPSGRVKLAIYAYKDL